jgi:hypothetical protein
MLIGFDALQRGLGKLSVNPERLAADLDASWEVLAEAVQTVMRRHGLPNPYEQLKALTRGQGITEASMREFIASLDLPAVDKQRLLEMTPGSYTGLAERLARRSEVRAPRSCAAGLATLLLVVRRTGAARRSRPTRRDCNARGRAVQATGDWDEVTAPRHVFANTWCTWQLRISAILITSPRDTS